MRVASLFFASLLLACACSSSKAVIASRDLKSSKLDAHLTVTRAKKTKVFSTPIQASDPRLGSSAVASLGFMNQRLRDEHIVCLKGEGVTRVDFWPGEDRKHWAVSWQNNKNQGFYAEIRFAEDTARVMGAGTKHELALTRSFWAAPSRKLVLLLDANGSYSLPQVLVDTKTKKYSTRSPDSKLQYDWKKVGQGHGHGRYGIHPLDLKS